ncbi:hypothetical protein B0F90DRAFT_1927374 [Multifurca ochricompacta]|uniref:DUF6535 domain-containing protein n=1 Tax=Multifurca ochricompacta TaxID=376703 RepID=A0AAD4LZS7_9AGAM|nr:hypothetical protein B0F90DRAFT_1927374 [Multifurca ochricompacta]
MSRRSSNDSNAGPEGISLSTKTVPPSFEPPRPSAPVSDNPAQIWSICLTHADKFDRALVETWKGDMDGILIFSGLFSAIVTAFLIDSYKSLQTDAATANANLTAQVVTLLARSTNQDNPPLPSMPYPNSQTAYLIINALWFLSLVFSLTCALAATLVQQWSRIYLQGIEERFNTHQRARMRTYLQQGVQKFHLSELVEGIPLLLHVALFLFFVGLVVFLFNLKPALAYIILALILPGFLLYVLLTALPVFFYDCPYKTPLTSVLSYTARVIATYSQRRRRDRDSVDYHWRPEKHSARLTTLWAQDGSAQGAELDHTALRWTLLALTDYNDLELFVDALPGLLQSDSGTVLTRDGGRAAQALLFGPDMLARHLVHLLHSAAPSEALALAPADRRRLNARAVTCLRTVSLLSRACDGPMLNSPKHWSEWAITYFNPVARDALALRAHPDPALATLAQGTALLLAWRALVAYRSFLKDLRHYAIVGSAPETRSRLSAGAYLVLALRDILRSLSGGGSDDNPGTPLAEAGERLLNGAVHAQLYAGAGAGGADIGMGPLARAAQEDMVKVKECLAALFMHAACSLPANAAGQETLQVLATPLGWQESCIYDTEPNKVMWLLLSVREAHGVQALTVLDADEVVALYRRIHAQPSHSNTVGEADRYVRPQRMAWRQGTV